MEDRVPTVEDIARASLQLDMLKRCFIIDDWLHRPQISTMKVQEHLWQGAINEFWDCVKQFDIKPRNEDHLADMAFTYNSAVHAYERALAFRWVIIDGLIEVHWRDNVLGAPTYQETLKKHWRSKGVKLYDTRADERASFAPWPLTARRADYEVRSRDAKFLHAQLRRERRYDEAADVFVKLVQPHQEQRENIKLAIEWRKRAGVEDSYTTMHMP